MILHCSCSVKYDASTVKSIHVCFKCYFGNRNFRSHVLSLPGAKVPCTELSLPDTFVPWNSRSQELSFPGTFAPVSENEVELSLLTRS